MNSIVLAYIGVHQIYQLALAAEEMGELEALHCSMTDKPGKWGAAFAPRFHVPSARPLGYEGIPAGKMIEFPWPLVSHRIGERLMPWRHSDNLHTNAWFDRVVARRLRHSHAKVFVGGETCALQSMRVAKQRGMRCVLDWSGIPNDFLHETALAAAAAWNMRIPETSNSPGMQRRKREELALADRILCCSEFQAEKLVAETGVDAARIEVFPLWVDAPFWRNRGRKQGAAGEPLRVIYAGGVSLKKGVPYLIEAVKRLGEDARLTLVGRPSPEMANLLAGLPANCTHRPYVAKDELRRLYAEHEVLVMPSLGDSFGFVAIEAMAAGLAVIVSSNAGVPLPAPDWRVPAGSVDAIADRLRFYFLNRAALAEDGRIAETFAAQWTPERYRSRVKALFAELIG